MQTPLVLGDWLESIDTLNDALMHPDFDATVHNPWFILGSIIFLAVALLRGWKIWIVVYFAMMILWYVIANYVSNSKQGGNSIFVLAGAIVGVGGFLIYFLLIRD